MYIYFYQGALDPLFNRRGRDILAFFSGVIHQVGWSVKRSINEDSVKKKAMTSLFVATRSCRWMNCIQAKDMSRFSTFEFLSKISFSDGVVIHSPSTVLAICTDLKSLGLSERGHGVVARCT